MLSKAPELVEYFVMKDCKDSTHFFCMRVLPEFSTQFFIYFLALEAALSYRWFVQKIFNGFNLYKSVTKKLSHELYIQSRNCTSSR
jgi:hypothetical protein